MGRIDPMEKYSYLVGQKINSWTVLYLKNDRRHADAVCVCECGTTKPVNIRNLINNCSKDCGCGRKKMLSKTRTKDMVGQKIGKLIIMELLPESNKFNRRLYRCKCECGNTVILPSGSLRSGHTLSCGCLVSANNAYIGKLLDEMNVENKPEYAVKIHRKTYRFDFYLPSYNLFIEYDGEQHYMTVRFCGDDAFKNAEITAKTQENDKIKDKYCEENGINILRIPYYEKNNIDEIIINHLQRLSEKGLVKTA